MAYKVFYVKTIIINVNLIDEFFNVIYRPDEKHVKTHVIIALLK